MQPGDPVCAPSEASRDYITWLIIAVSTAVMCARLATVESPRGGTPLLSANDRSRWSTIRALVDEGTYALDNVIFRAPDKRDPKWYSIDLVKHRGPDGRQHFYSSKPTLLTTLAAIPYWVMKSIGGVSIVSQTYYVVRVTLLLFQVLPTVLFLVLLARMCDQLTTNVWSKLLVVTSASFATPLTTFVVTLNNHLPGAIFVLGATWAALRIWSQSQPKMWQFVVAGVSAAMTAACELPGLSFLCVMGAILFWKAPVDTILGFFPPVIIVGIGIFGTNYWAHGTWSTPYANRSDGPVVLVVPDVDASLLQPGLINPELHRRISAATPRITNASLLAERPTDRGFLLWNPDDDMQYALHLNGSNLEIRRWNNWYEYPGSYWSSGKKQGVDLGEPSKLVYAFHILFGHHGIFSLTPIWLFSVVGVAIWLSSGDIRLRALAAVTILLTIVCLVFFILLRDLDDRNYGGVSCCFRWMMWLIPLWLLNLIPALDAISERPLLRKLAIAFLLVSVFSATYNSRNPWSHPWLFEYWTHLGWIKY